MIFFCVVLRAESYIIAQKRDEGRVLGIIYRGVKPLILK